jgi:beta-lactamase class D
VKKLYFDQLPFQKRSQQIVRDLMLQENNTQYKFSYKTGEGSDHSNAIAWVVGWVEENKHVYFFVTLVKASGRNDLPSVSMKISKSILQKFGFFRGEM